jgi:hypothetical protein
LLERRRELRVRELLLRDRLLLDRVERPRLRERDPRAPVVRPRELERDGDRRLLAVRERLDTLRLELRDLAPPLEDFVSPFFARVLFTTRAAISFFRAPPRPPRCRLLRTFLY